MSLIHKQKMTQKGLAAKRRNGRAGHGPVTPAGKARANAARLLHGFYSTRQDEIMTALGEDPREFEDLLKSLLESFQPRPGLETQLVLRMARVLWRQRRADRVQDAVALKNIRSRTRVEEFGVGPRLLEIDGIYQKLLAFGAALGNEDPTPAPQELEASLAEFKNAGSESLQDLIGATQTYLAVLRKGSPQLSGVNGSAGSTSTEGELAEARENLEAAYVGASCHFRQTLDLLLAESDRIASPENAAALMAPSESPNELFMQRMEDSCARQLWRLTRLLITLQHSGLGDAERE
jgi:hypothetical protein